METYIGFDSAWMDKPKAPGAICAIEVEGGNCAKFHKPQLASFAEALAFIQKVRSGNGITLVALDQPTVVPNLTSMRPVDRVAASLISWLGGGVQPANRGKLGMFCDNAPIWRFIAELEFLRHPEQPFLQDPELAREARNGLYLMEVFPALALASLNDEFMQRLGGPKYNPARKRTFCTSDWSRVAETATREARALGYEELAKWCHDAGNIVHPQKADQDKLDAVLCILVALHWRLRRRSESLLLGNLASGYMILPVSVQVRKRLTEAARKCAVPVDGQCPP